MNTKYIGLLLIFLGFSACNDIEDVSRNEAEVLQELSAGTANFSKYVAVGASFSAGFTDNALFVKGQENSFPNLMAMQFAKIGGGDFTQPLMNDNIGGFLSGVVQSTAFLPRLYFNGTGPTLLSATSTTDISTVLSGSFSNIGIPGAKSLHLTLPGSLYGGLNPYFGRMNPGTNSIIEYAMAQQPTFFSLSEIGGNDVLSYATGGGVGVDRTGNFNAASYGPSDITDPTIFEQIFTNVVNSLTANGAKGVVGTVPYITRLPHFTTVPYNPVPLDVATAAALNSAAAYGAYNSGVVQALTYLVSINVITQAQATAEIAKRNIIFTASANNAVVILDETLIDLTGINPALKSMRQATAADLLVLPASTFIGTLAIPGNPQTVNGVSVPLEDKWVLIPSEQLAVKNAVDAYNTTINAVATAKGLAIVDFNAILEEAATTGLPADNFTFTTKLVTGGLVGLDGIHLTSRGYAVMANKFLEAIDAKYGSNFIASGNVAKVGDYPTNYSPSLR